MCPLSAPPPFRIGDLWGFGGGGGGMLLAGTGDSMANGGNRRTGKMFYLYICKGKWVAKKMERRILKINFTVRFWSYDRLARKFVVLEYVHGGMGTSYRNIA